MRRAVRRGVVEFAPTRWALADSAGTDDLGAIEYRPGAKGSVGAIPAQGVELMEFEFVDANRVRLLGGGDCVLVRVGGAAAGSGGAPPRTSTASAAPSAALLTLDDLSGYRCPDGAKLVVQSCYDQSDDANCGVVQAHQPRLGTACR